MSGIAFPLVSGKRNTNTPASTDDVAKSTRGKGSQTRSRTRVSGATIPPIRAATEHAPMLRALIIQEEILPS